MIHNNVTQPVLYKDRDFADEHHESLGNTPDTQLELPFKPALQVKKTKFEIKKELDEIFVNFLTVIKGKDVDLNHKLQVIRTVLGNYKSGTPDMSNRSQSLILDLFSELL